MTTLHPHCACGNAARYVNQHGKLTCGVCPLVAGDDSIRVTDVPLLLAWARSFILEHSPGQGAAMQRSIAELQQIVQRGPKS